MKESERVPENRRRCPHCSAHSSQHLIEDCKSEAWACGTFVGSKGKHLRSFVCRANELLMDVVALMNHGDPAQRAAARDSARAMAHDLETLCEDLDGGDTRTT